MNNDVFNIINEQFSMVPEAFGGKVEIDKVIEAEELLGVKLPEEYIEFICMYGCGAVGSTVILGLGEAQFVSTPSFVDETINLRNELPDEYKSFVAIGIDGAGNPIGFKSPGNEIILFDHDFGEEVFLANNFSEYLRKACYNQLNIQF